MRRTGSSGSGSKTVKVAPRNVDPFLAAPPDPMGAVLLYGPDEGLVRERAHTLVAAAVDDPADPFLVTNLVGKDVQGQPYQLMDAAMTQSLTGGRHVVWMTGAVDANADSFAELLKPAKDLNLVVVEAADLPPRSRLRKLFESADNAAAIGCYLDDPGTLKKILEAAFAQADVTISPEAKTILAARLGNSRGVSRQEIEKLILFAGPGGTLNAETIFAMIGDNARHGIDAIVYAAFDGNQEPLDRAFDRALKNDVSIIQILRAAQMHAQRLHSVAAGVSARVPARNVDQAIKSLKPPVFFKQKAQFREQCLRWRPGLLERVMALLVEAECDAKSTGFPAVANGHIVLVKICSAARRNG